MVGKKIGKYKILEEVGRGGMGVVYKGLQISLDRTVALKMLPPQFALSNEFLERFQREARVLARLAHKNIVHIYDLEKLAGAFFIIMEFIEGKSLSKIISTQAPLPLETVKKIAIGVASALSAAHQAGIVHRDVKPENIMIDKYNEIKVMDFGVARVADESFKTRAGIRLGTPEYMSPEQAKGLCVDAQSDIYSLGIILYEMVTGEVPFTGEDSLAVALKHVQEPVVPPSRRKPDIDRGLERIILKALEKDKNSRYRTADEICEDLVQLYVPEEVKKKEEKSLAFQYCPECGAELKEDSLRCPQCRKVVRRACPYCHNLFDVVFKVCPHCSKELPPLTEAETAKLALEEKPAAKKPLGRKEARKIVFPSLPGKAALKIPAIFKNPKTLFGLAGALLVLVVAILIVANISKSPEPQVQTPPQTPPGNQPTGKLTTPPSKPSEIPTQVTGQKELGPAEMVSRAKEYFDEGAYDSCISEMKKVLEVDPSNTVAAEYITKAEQSKPQVEAYLKEAARAYREGDFSKSVEEYKKVLAISPNHLKASTLLKQAEAQLERLRSDPVSNRNAIEAIIERQRQGMENENISLLVQDVSEEKKSEIRQGAEELFATSNVISVTISELSINIQGSEAGVSFKRTIVLRSKATKQQTSQTQRVQCYLKKINNIWKILAYSND